MQRQDEGSGRGGGEEEEEEEEERRGSERVGGRELKINEQRQEQRQEQEQDLGQAVGVLLVPQGCILYIYMSPFWIWSCLPYH